MVDAHNVQLLVEQAVETEITVLTKALPSRYKLFGRAGQASKFDIEYDLDD
jgi:hypothetical protein